MIGGARGSWQTIIADLALILFMVTAAAMGGDSAKPAPIPRPASSDNPLPAMAEPLGVYRPGEGAPPLDRWLSQQAPDDRQRLTILARYPAGGAETVAATAMTLAHSAEAAGMRARILLEPSDSADVAAVLTYDRGEDWHDHCRDPRITGAQGVATKDERCE
jgi:hypothetical protein